VKLAKAIDGGVVKGRLKDANVAMASLWLCTKSRNLGKANASVAKKFEVGEYIIPVDVDGRAPGHGRRDLLVQG
jgi:hypothetical protein